MTSGLRKAHKYIWLLLIIIVPVIMFFSIKDLDFSSSENDSITFETSKKNPLKTTENNLIRVTLYKDSIEIILKSTLKNASSIVYASKTSRIKKQIIGQLTSAGIYNFSIEKQPISILVYDELKDKLITKIDF